MKLSNGTEYRMDPTFKKQWLKALRSGKYRQVRGFTGYSNNRCALGVCIAEGMSKAVFGKYVQKSLLHSEAQKIIGMMNDGWDGKKNVRPKGFSKIADWIQENL